MTDSNWQLAVLRDLGATQRGFADTAPAEPRPAPVQGPDPAEIAGTAQVPAQIPPQDASAGGTGGFPGLSASGEAATASGASGSGEFPASGPQGATPHADAPVAGPAASAQPAPDLGTATGPSPTPGPAPTPHADAPVAGPAADLGTATGPAPTSSSSSGSSSSGADTPWGAPPSSGDQPSTGGDGFPGIQDGRPAASGGQWGAPADGAAKPDGAWGAPADGGAPKPDNAWGAPGSAGQPAAASAGGGDQSAPGDAPWGTPPANAGGGEPSAPDGGFPGVAAQQNAEPAQPLGAPPAPDASWGASAGGADAASPFPGGDAASPSPFPGGDAPSPFPGGADPASSSPFPGGDAPSSSPFPGGPDAPSPFPGMPGSGPEGMPGPALDHTMGGRQGAHEGMPGQGQAQDEPMFNSDFAWEAAINPVLGGVEQQQDDAQSQEQQAAAQPQQPEQPVPNPQAQAQQGAAGPNPADELVRRNVHGDKIGKRIGRGVRKAVGGGSAMSAQQQAAFADLMGRAVPSFRQIAIASVRGGAGKTTMAALFASELARHRQDRVVAIDADAELGSLPLRLGLVPQLSLFELAQANPSTFDEVSRFLSQTSEGLWVLSSTRGGRMSREFDVPTFQRALSSVSRFVSAAVVDCGAGILTEVNQGIIAQTHALVLVTPGTVDGALSARGALEWFANNGRQHVFQRAVVAMVSHAPQINADLGRAQEMLTQWGMPVVHVPYDRQIATGAAIDLDKVGGATRQAATKIVYQAFARSLGMPGVQ